MAQTISSPSAHCLRKSVCASAALHFCVLSVLVADAVWPLFPQTTISNPNGVMLTAVAGLPSQQAPNEAEVALANDDSEPDAAEIEPSVLTADEVARHPSDVLADRVARNVRRSLVAAQDKTPDEQREQLSQLAGQLSGVSSEKTVDEMAGKFRQWMGTRQRAERPVDKPLEGEFDFATAQLHDVRRESDGGSGAVYFGVLVDAAGRRFESRMDPVEGESAYKTMQLVKANPLAEMVYRRIVMAFLDNIIEAGKQAQQAVESTNAGLPTAKTQAEAGAPP